MLTDPDRLSTLVRGLTDDPADDIELDVEPAHLNGRSQVSNQKILRYALGGDDDTLIQRDFQERASEATTYQDWRTKMMVLVGIDICGRRSLIMVFTGADELRAAVDEQLGARIGLSATA